MKAIDDVISELSSARNKFPPFTSAHEGYAILWEEVDELWEEVKKNPQKRDLDKMRAECVQVAAMSIRMILDICDGRDT